MGLLERISARTVDRSTGTRSSIDQWIDQYLLPSAQFNQFNYNGTTYPIGLNTTWTQSRIKEITQSLPGYASALRGCPPAFAAQMVRATVLSQARFTFRNLPSQPNARKMFGTRALGVLENPWPKATTGQLVARMEWHAGLAGNAYVVRQPGRLRVLRPDWVAILFGSQLEPDDPMHALDGEVIGYVYQNGGFTNPTSKPQTLLPDDVAHWSPMPDPERAEIGMSWITPAVRDLQADRAATDHKLNFFANGATPNMVVKGIPAATAEQFNEIVEAMELKHRGVANAYRTLYLTAGADATVVGSNLSEINLPGVQGASETRISFLSRVPAALLGTADGMKGSSLNAGNYAETRRTFADSWIYPTLQDLCAATAPLVTVPSGAELWFDPADMPILREDSKDAAGIEQVKATTITMYVKEGFTAESAIAAVRGQDITLLKHTGMVSVQLQPPGSAPPGAPPAPDAGPKVPALRATEDNEEPDEETIALLVALDEFSSWLADGARSWDPAKHPRNPKGSPGGGKFKSLVDRLTDALKEHHKSGGRGDPFEGFSREQLRLTAKKRGIEIKRGEDRDSIAKKLLDHLGGPKLAPSKSTSRKPHAHEHPEATTPSGAGLAGPASGPVPLVLDHADHNGLKLKIKTLETRPEYAKAKTHSELAFVYTQHVKALTGQHSDFHWQDNKLDLENAKQFAEGFTRALEQFPEVRLQSWRGVHDEERRAYAVADVHHDEIVLNDIYFGVDKRGYMMQRLHADEVGHFHPDNNESPASVALHEFSHLLHMRALDEEKVTKRVDKLVKERALEGGSPDDVSRYAQLNVQELVAESMADVLINGSGSSPMSKDIYGIVNDEYAAKYGGRK